MTEISITKQLIHTEQTTQCINEQITIEETTQIIIENTTVQKYQDLIYDIDFIKKIGNNNTSTLSDDVMKLLYPKPIYRLKEDKKFSKFFKNVNLDIDSKKKKVNGFLNKVSSDNYFEILKKICMFITNNDKDDFKILLEYLVHKMFDIAINQQSFCKLYVNMFNNIKTYFKNNNKFNLPINNMIFDNIVNKIKLKYIEYCKIDYSDDLSIKYDDFCDYNKNKQQMVGIFQFMGELYREKIITELVIEEYLNKLVSDIIDNKLPTKIIELQCECLCKFINTLSNKRLNRLILKDIKILSHCDKYTSRIKYMFLDLLDNMKQSSNRFAK